MGGKALDERTGEAPPWRTAWNVQPVWAFDQRPLSRRRLPQRHGLWGGAPADCLSRTLARSQSEAEAQPNGSPSKGPSRDAARRCGDMWPMRSCAESELCALPRRTACVLYLPCREEVATNLPTTARRMPRSRPFCARPPGSSQTQARPCFRTQARGSSYFVPLGHTLRLSRTARWNAIRLLFARSCPARGDERSNRRQESGTNAAHQPCTRAGSSL